MPLLGRGNLSNVLAATAVALEFGVPLEAIAARIGDAAPAEPSRRVIRLRRRRHARRRFLQLEPVGARARARGARPARPAAPRGRGARRDARARRRTRPAARRVRPRGRGGRRRRCSSPSAARRRARWPTAAIAAGMPAARSHFAHEREAAASRSRDVRAGDLVLVKGSRGIGTDVVADRLKAEWR